MGSLDELSIPNVSNWKVLDLGCGMPPQCWLYWYGKYKFHSFTGIDKNLLPDTPYNLSNYKESQDYNDWKNDVKSQCNIEGEEEFSRRFQLQEKRIEEFIQQETTLDFDLVIIHNSLQFLLRNDAEILLKQIYDKLKPGAIISLIITSQHWKKRYGSIVEFVLRDDEVNRFVSPFTLIFPPKKIYENDEYLMLKLKKEEVISVV